jgi:hypothetical protein
VISVGSFVEISGNTTPGDSAPSIEHAQIHVLRNATLPVAAPKTLDTLLTGSEDSQWVQTAGIVHSVSLEDRLPPDFAQGVPRNWCWGSRPATASSRPEATGVRALLVAAGEQEDIRPFFA